MKPDLKTCLFTAAVTIFLILPLGLYFLSDAPQRTLFKEALSIVTLLSFSLMMGQFFLARSNAAVQSLLSPRTLQWLHKTVAYGAMTVLLLHPLLIVLPRYFEAGVRPVDALITMLTTFDNLGVVLGLIAWVLMVVLGASAMLRMRLIKRFRIKYRHWRYFHGALATTFVVLALWHSIYLGRHTGTAMSILFIAISTVGISLLAKMYLAERPGPALKPQGAKT